MQRYLKLIEISPFIIEHIPVLSENIETTIINNELKKLILFFTNGLSPKQRLVFTLSDLEGLKTEEIKEISGLSSGQIKSNLHWARKHIKNKIDLITL
jgi:RNA polymerase sigma-70 factor (ECF subfamily)